MTPPLPVDRQREHQANERTFLAWLRTSIALIGFGLAIARFSLFVRELQVNAEPPTPLSHAIFNYESLGIAMIGFGVATILLAAWQYNRVFWQIERGAYRPSRLLVWVMTTIVFTLGVFSIPLVLWRGRQEPCFTSRLLEWQAHWRRSQSPSPLVPLQKPQGGWPR